VVYSAQLTLAATKPGAERQSHRQGAGREEDEEEVEGSWRDQQMTGSVKFDVAVSLTCVA
jgi:hypothetical protein